MATPRVMAGWDPLGDRPIESDDQVLELLTAAVFQARFRPDVVRKRWPRIRRAFADFRLPVVASWGDEKLEELLASPGMIRSPKKIRATLRNARDLLERSRRFGSALGYLRARGGGDGGGAADDDEALVAELDGWAHYAGAPSLRWLVRRLRARRGEGEPAIQWT